MQNFTIEVPSESTGHSYVCFQLVRVADDGCKAVAYTWSAIFVLLMHLVYQFCLEYTELSEDCKFYC